LLGDQLIEAATGEKPVTLTDTAVAALAAWADALTETIKRAMMMIARDLFTLSPTHHTFI
jgi:hypothetical protein